jgi:hypothetical protein
LLGLKPEDLGMSMSRRTLRMFLGALATAAVAIFAVPANAVVYGSGFDPLSFSGTGFFQFDNHCETDNGGFGTYSQALCNVIFLSASVDMVETAPSGTGHLNFGPSTNIVDIIINGGLLVGVDSRLFGPAFTGTSCTGSLCNGAPWWIEWQHNSPPTTLPLNEVLLFTGTCDGPCFPATLPSGVAPIVTFTRQSDGVPEPGTLGLILGGVGAAWLARRRRAAA